MINRELLELEIEKSGKTREEIASVLGITRHGLYNKLQGKTEFLASQMKTICDILDLDFIKREQIFFNNDSELDSHKKE